MLKQVELTVLCCEAKHFTLGRDALYILDMCACVCACLHFPQQVIALVQCMCIIV